MSTGILKKAELRSTAVNHFELVGTLNNKVLGFQMAWKLSIIILLIACRPWTDLQPHPFGILMSKIRMLQRLLHGIVTSFLIKSVFGESLRKASGFSG